MGIMWDLLKKKNFYKFLLYLCVSSTMFQIPMNLSGVYLTKELQFSRESISFIKTLMIPFNLTIPFVTNLISKDRPVSKMVNLSYSAIFMSNYCVFVLLGMFPRD